MVLSLYNTALHCAGSLPSAETGCSTIRGTESSPRDALVHGVHFTAWIVPRCFEPAWVLRKNSAARPEHARAQGYGGARWRRCGPTATIRRRPSPLLIWQQPHPIYYAELCYRSIPRANPGALARHRLRERRVHGDFAVLDPQRDNSISVRR